MFLKMVIVLILNQIVVSASLWRHLTSESHTGANSIALSPDGNWYVVGKNTEIRIYPFKTYSSLAFSIPVASG